ncbi:MAG: hypothetical protein JNK49_08415, partial [Planctomycetes bacterium]|nr:hypothetical protein [Planctomycetota bacterium]
MARWRMLGLLACAACARPSPDPAPRAFDVSTLAAEAVPGAVLDECHRPLRDRMRHLEVTVQLPSGAKWQVFTALPEALRAVGERGSYLVRGSQVFALGAPAPDSVPAPLAAELRALLPLLDAAAFGPLHRAQQCRRDGTHFVLRDASGHETALQLRAGTLLPERFGTGDAAVACVDYLRTSSTWM